VNPSFKDVILSRHAVARFGARLVVLVGAVLMGTGVSCGNSVEPALTGGIRVLFIGNSLTYVNNLPGTLSALALSAGDTIQVRMVAEPNFALIDHYVGGSNALGEIDSGRWNFVVLQQGPSTTPINRDSLILTAKLFEPRIRAAGATPALYMVWPTLDRFAFFDAARVSYQMAATAVNGIFLPAGRAWVTALESDPGLSLYDADGLHPSPLGTYLAALVIYERLTGHDARQLPGAAVVDGRTLATPEATVRLLQRAAHETNALYPP
jgi:hypothetical protein